MVSRYGVRVATYVNRSLETPGVAIVPPTNTTGVH